MDLGGPHLIALTSAKQDAPNYVWCPQNLGEPRAAARAGCGILRAGVCLLIGGGFDGAYES